MRNSWWAAAAAMGLLAFGLADDANAQVNANCIAAGATRNCTDVGQGGVNFGNGVSTMNIDANNTGNVAINSGVVGVSLTQTGASGSDGVSITGQTATIPFTFDPDNDASTNNDVTINVVSSNGTDPLLVNGDLIQDDGDGSFTIRGGAAPSAIVQSLADQPALESFLVLLGPPPAGALFPAM